MVGFVILSLLSFPIGCSDMAPFIPAMTGLGGGGGGLLFIHRYLVYLLEGRIWCALFKGMF